jgi:hypothetical protein
MGGWVAFVSSLTQSSLSNGSDSLNLRAVAVVVHFEFARLFFLTIAHIRKLTSALRCHGKSIPSSSKSSNNFTWKKQKVLNKSSKKKPCVNLL